MDAEADGSWEVEFSAPDVEGDYEFYASCGPDEVEEVAFAAGGAPDDSGQYGPIDLTVAAGELVFDASLDKSSGPPGDDIELTAIQCDGDSGAAAFLPVGRAAGQPVPGRRGRAAAVRHHRRPVRWRRARARRHRARHVPGRGVVHGADGSSTPRSSPTRSPPPAPLRYPPPPTSPVDPPSTGDHHPMLRRRSVLIAIPLLLLLAACQTLIDPDRVPEGGGQTVTVSAGGVFLPGEPPLEGPNSCGPNAAVEVFIGDATEPAGSGTADASRGLRDRHHGPQPSPGATRSSPSAPSRRRMVSRPTTSCSRPRSIVAPDLEMSAAPTTLDPGQAFDVTGTWCVSQDNDSAVPTASVSFEGETHDLTAAGPQPFGESWEHLVRGPRRARGLRRDGHLHLRRGGSRSPVRASPTSLRWKRWRRPRWPPPRSTSPTTR